MCQSKADGGRRCTRRRGNGQPAAAYTITDDDKATYSTGGCYVLAAALHERTGWPLVGVAIAGESRSNGYQHYLVRSPDGNLVDVNGALAEDDVLAHWASVVDEDRGEPGHDCVVRELASQEVSEANRFYRPTTADVANVDQVTDAVLSSLPGGTPKSR